MPVLRGDGANAQSFLCDTDMIICGFISPVTAQNARGRRPRRYRPVCATETVLLLGGTGRIGGAAAEHIARERPDVELVLAGRSASKGRRSVDEVRRTVAGAKVRFVQVDGNDESSLRRAFGLADVVINTAGPFSDEPNVLKSAIDFGVPKYVDVADPMPYIRRAKSLECTKSTALLSAGAFPGLSNLLAIECAHRLNEEVKDLEFAYFTAGLGGSGTINLYITNVGFGTPVPTFRDGKLAPRLNAGRDLRVANFFFDRSDESHRRVGTQKVWAWPFPEVATVSEALHISGKSDVRMGTAPDIWNDIMGVMVDVVPRSWWLKERFSRGVALFSQPLVAVADAMLGGETHAMRVDVYGSKGGHVAAVQAHDSFRVCVGQSVAEFCLYLLENASLPAGVFTPEELLSDDAARSKLLSRMTSTRGTFTYRLETLH
mmetsp:Transcript_468/g.1614  ORF Transcript_468/g.1614 Transcript_468/m.1614 type:complete len:432 (-) Transcript_468:45-1340(-)